MEETIIVKVSGMDFERLRKIILGAEENRVSMVRKYREKKGIKLNKAIPQVTADDIVDVTKEVSGFLNIPLPQPIPPKPLSRPTLEQKKQIAQDYLKQNGICTNNTN